MCVRTRQAVCMYPFKVYFFWRIVKFVIELPARITQLARFYVNVVGEGEGAGGIKGDPAFRSGRDTFGI